MGAPDFTHPLPADLYDSAAGPDVLDYIRDNDAATASWLEGLDPPGKQAGFKRLKSGLIEEWDGSAWKPKPLAYVAKTGAMDITGSLGITAVGPAGLTVKVTDAAQDKRIVAMVGNAAGEAYFGRQKDDLSAWTAGLKIGADGKLYDIATGLPLLSGTSLNYLPLTGGTLTGNLAINAAARWPMLTLTDPANTSGLQKAGLQLATDGSLVLGHLNDAASAWVGGISVGNDNILRDVKTNGMIWHNQNDGAGSGLDADLLDGLNPSSTGGANVILKTDAGGASTISTLWSGQMRGGAGGAGCLMGFGPANTINFRWGNPRFSARIDESVQVDLMDAVYFTLNGNMPGYMRVGNQYIQWATVQCYGDNSAVGNWAMAFPGWCPIAECCVNRGQADGSGNVYAAHMLWVNQSQYAVGITDAGFSVGNTWVWVIGYGW